MSKKITRKNYKHELNSNERKALLDELFYDYTQNLKIPFLYFIRQPRQILIASIVFIVMFFYEEDIENSFLALINASKYILIVFLALYKFTNQRYEDILPKKL